MSENVVFSALKRIKILLSYVVLWVGIGYVGFYVAGWSGAIGLAIIVTVGIAFAATLITVCWPVESSQTLEMRVVDDE